jgi:hypothetical protein
MSIFYVRVYKPNFNKSSFITGSTIGPIFNAPNRNTIFFSEMFYFICNKYSVQDAFFLYNNQRVFISKLSIPFFNNVINWDQFGFNQIQLWFIKDSFLADRQFYYKTTSFQNLDIFFLPTNWHTCDAVFTENSGLTKTIGDSSARLFAIGKTLISLINEAIEPEAYAAVVPLRNSNGTFKIKADNVTFFGQAGNVGNRRPWQFWGGTVNFSDFPFFNQIITKTTNTSNIEPAAVFIVQVNQPSVYYSLQNAACVINAFAGTPAPNNTWLRNKTKNTFIICNMCCLKTLIGCQFCVNFRSTPNNTNVANPLLDIILLARRPIIGNEVGILCPNSALDDRITDNIEINLGLPKKILNYLDLLPGAVDAATGNIIASRTGRYYEIKVGGGTKYGNNYFQYPFTSTIPSDTETIQAYLLVSCFNVFYQNGNARPDFISIYKMTRDQAALDAAIANREDEFPDLRNQYLFVNKIAFGTGTKMPPNTVEFYEGKVILEWTNPDTSQVFDVPFSTDTYIKINPFVRNGDVGSWRASPGPYGVFSPSMINICSPQMFDQSKFTPLNSWLQRFCPYFYNDHGIIQELPNVFARKGTFAGSTSKATVDTAILQNFEALTCDRSITLAAINRDYPEYQFGREWDFVLKKGSDATTGSNFSFANARVANYDQTIVCSAKPLENGVRIFKNYIDRKLYYRFINFPKFMIKIPYDLFTTVFTPLADIVTGFNIPTPGALTGSYTIQGGIQKFLSLEQFQNINISNCSTFNAAYQNVFTTSVLERKVISDIRIRFVIGFFECSIAKTVTLTLFADRNATTSEITFSIPGIPDQPYRWYINPNISQTNRNSKNDLNNITSQFDFDSLGLATYSVPNNSFFRGPQTIYWTIEKFSSLAQKEYLFKNTKEFSIVTQLNLERMQGAAVCLPQINPVYGVRPLIIASDLFSTSRGQLIPSFIENIDSRNVINFQNITQFKSFSFYFNSIIATNGRARFINPQPDEYRPDVYIFFK